MPIHHARFHRARSVRPQRAKPGLDKPGLDKPGVDKPGLVKCGLAKPALAGIRRSMRGLAGVACAVAMAIAPATGPGRAQGTQVADLSRASCADMRTLSKSDQLQLMAFLFAYYAGAAQRPVVDTGRIQASGQAMAEICDKQPATPLIGEQARAIFLGDPLLRSPDATGQGAAQGTPPPLTTPPETARQVIAPGQGRSAAPGPPADATPGKPQVQP